MAYADKYGAFFGRRVNRADFGGPVTIHHVADGEIATRLDASVYPIGSDLSARYEHPEGIILHAYDALRIGIEIEP